MKTICMSVTFTGLEMELIHRNPEPPRAHLQHILPHCSVLFFFNNLTESKAVIEQVENGFMENSFIEKELEIQER